MDLYLIHKRRLLFPGHPSPCPQSVRNRNTTPLPPCVWTSFMDGPNGMIYLVSFIQFKGIELGLHGSLEKEKKPELGSHRVN